jgi:hypothetical protein
LGQDRLKAFSVFGTGSRGAKIAIDEVDGRLGPSSLLGARLQRILHPQAFLIADGLMRAGLADVDDGFATEMLWCNEFGRGHRSPPVKR